MQLIANLALFFPIKPAEAGWELGGVGREGVDRKRLLNLFCVSTSRSLLSFY